MSVFIPSVRHSIKKAMMGTEKMGNSPGRPHGTEKWDQRAHKTCLKASNEIITSTQAARWWIHKWQSHQEEKDKEILIKTLKGPLFLQIKKSHRF